jgi:hypothetical protein
MRLYLSQANRPCLVAKLGAERPREIGEAVEAGVSLLHLGEPGTAETVAGVLPVERVVRLLDLALRL